jgi:hypothetical protein
LRHIAEALKENGLIFITVKEGTGEIWLRYLLKKNEPAGSPAHYSSFPGVRRFEVANRDLKNDDVLSLFKIGKQSLYIKI